MRGDQDGHRQRRQPTRDAKGQSKDTGSSLELARERHSVLLGYENDATTEGTIRRGLRGLARVTDIAMIALVAYFVLPVTDMRADNLFAYLLISLLFLVFGTNIWSSFSESNLVNLSWVGIRALFYGLCTWVSGQFFVDTYRYAQESGYGPSSISTLETLPLALSIFGLCLSLVDHSNLVLHEKDLSSASLQEPRPEQ